jgi:cytochrome c oxidase subunit 2
MIVADVGLFPPQRSTIAADVDSLYVFIIGVTVAVSTATALVLFYFAIRYRRRKPDEVPAPIHGSWALEAVWTMIPMAVVLVIFVWSVKLYFRMISAPDNAMEVYVTGRQWMWKVQHPGGQREILGSLPSAEAEVADVGSEMHVPVGTPVKLILTSEDVIHSFYVPAFRLKQDAVPGRYTTLWFEATKAGRYRMYCAEYCGMNHSKMRGWIVAQEPAEFQQWLASSADRSLALRGRQRFLQYQCISCHSADPDARGPSLEGIYRQRVALQDGSTVIADEAYLRESILNPRAKIVAGFQPIMPTFQGQIIEDDLTELIAYLKSLKHGDIPKRNEAAEPPVVKPEPAPEPAKP